MFRAVALDKLTLPLKGMRINPEVARRLPFDLACRYQALPVAEDDGRLTVAMANPNDMEARQAILAALPPINPRNKAAHPATPLRRGDAAAEQRWHSGNAESGTEADARGSSVYLVRGEPSAIDSLMADVWPGRARRALRLLVVDSASTRVKARDRAGLHDYAQALGRLLGAESVSITGDDPAALDDAVPEDWPSHPRKLLLVVQGNDDPSGPAALARVVYLARLSGAVVTVLAVVPPVPQRSPSEDGGDLTALLTTKSTAVGQAAQQLVQAGIAATLRLRQGSLDRQLHREVIETDYDLVLVGSKPILRSGSRSAPDVQSRRRSPQGTRDRRESRSASGRGG